MPLPLHRGGYICYSLWKHAGDDPGLPWRLPAVMMWGVYMALLTVVLAYAHLFLPSATTIAVHQAALVDDVFSAFGIGLPLCWVAVFVAGLGTTWLALAVVGLFLLLVAAELALWMEKIAFLGLQTSIGLQTSTAHTTIINH